MSLPFDAVLGESADRHPDNQGLSAHDDAWRIDPVRFRIFRAGVVIVVEPFVDHDLLYNKESLRVWIQDPSSGDRQHEAHFRVEDPAMAKLVHGLAVREVAGEYAEQAMNAVFRQRIMCSDSGLRWLLKAMPESFVRSCIESVWRAWQRDSEMLIEDDSFILSGIIAAVAADAMDVAIDMLKTELQED